MINRNLAGPEIQHYLATFPTEYRDDLYQEAALSWLEQACSDLREGQPVLGEVCRRAMRRAFRRMTYLVDPLPRRSMRRIYALLKDQAGQWTSNDAPALARKHNTRPDIILHVLAVINASGSGIRMVPLEEAYDNACLDEEQYDEEQIWQHLDTLNPRDAEIIRRRYLIEEPVSQADLARQFGVSQPRINQLEHRALKRLRESLTAHAA